MTPSGRAHFAGNPTTVIRPYPAGQRLDLGLAEYRTTGGIFEVLEDWRELLQFQIQLARFQTDLGRSLASLERAVGCQLAALPEPAVPLAVPEMPDTRDSAPAPLVPPQPAPEPVPSSTAGRAAETPAIP